MPKSLDDGPSKIVPVKMPQVEKQAAQAACDDGETLSGLIREATRREVKRRQRRKTKFRNQKTKGNKMSNATTFSGKNYSIEAVDDQLVISHPQGTETFDTFQELVESHPICEEAREFFFGADDAK